MLLTFYKYQGAGNDFIIFDDRKNVFPAGATLVASLCDRRFGIGADGLMLLREKKGYDYEMVYFNSDGSQSLCGNGSRCMLRFAQRIGLVKDKAGFLTTDGEHRGMIREGSVSITMHDVKRIEELNGDYFLNTGSPHYVKYVRDLQSADVEGEGRKIRNSPPYAAQGTNVNFVEAVQYEGRKLVNIRTYERGVERETWSCGTGVTAVALVAAIRGESTTESYCEVHARGGNLTVHFRREGNSFRDIELEGPAEHVFTGQIEIHG